MSVRECGIASGINVNRYKNWSANWLRQRTKTTTRKRIAKGGKRRGSSFQVQSIATLTDCLTEGTTDSSFPTAQKQDSLTVRAFRYFFRTRSAPLFTTHPRVQPLLDSIVGQHGDQAIENARLKPLPGGRTPSIVKGSNVEWVWGSPWYVERAPRKWDGGVRNE